MNNDAPTRETVGDGWTPGWINWLKQVRQALGGWDKCMTASATFDFGLIAAASEASTTVTVTGARANDVVAVTPSVNTAGVIYAGVVTANNTVTIYAKNFTAGGINPASTTFRVIVFQN